MALIRVSRTIRLRNQQKRIKINQNHLIDERKFMFYSRLYLTILFLLIPFTFPQKSNSANNSTPINQSKNLFDCQKFIKDQIGQKRLIIKYDKFKKQTEITTDNNLAINELQFRKPDGNLPDGAGNFLMLDVHAFVPDDISKANPIFVIVSITSHTFENWKYLKCQDVNWLVDNKPLNWISVKYSSDTGSDYGAAGIELFENFDIALTIKQFNKLVSSKNIDFEICQDEFVFNEKQYCVMQWVNDQITALQNKK